MTRFQKMCFRLKNFNYSYDSAHFFNRITAVKRQISFFSQALQCTNTNASKTQKIARYLFSFRKIWIQYTICWYPVCTRAIWRLQCHMNVFLTCTKHVKKTFMWHHRRHQKVLYLQALFLCPVVKWYK